MAILPPLPALTENYFVNCNFEISSNAIFMSAPRVHEKSIQHTGQYVGSDYQDAKGEEGYCTPEESPMGIVHHENLETKLPRPHTKSSPP
jgi:hypothetical protein